MKKLVYHIVEHLKSPKGIISSFFIVLFIFILCLFNLNLPIIFVLSLENASEILSARLNEIITLFGGAIAIFAIIFSIIQLKKDYEEVISILFSETYLFPFLGMTIGMIINLILAKTLYLSDLISPNILVKISVLSIYLVILELVFLVFIIYRIYKLLTTDFLFNKFLSIIRSIALEPEKEYQSEFLFKQRKRLLDRYRQSIFEDDKILTDKISTVLIDILDQQPNSFFTSDIGRNFYLFFENSVDDKNKDACYKIINIIAEFWNNAIIKNNTTLIEKLSYHPRYYYDLICNNNFNKKELSEYLLLRLSEVYNYTLVPKYKDQNNIDQLKAFNQFSQMIIYSFNQFLKRILEQKDFQTWRYALNTISHLGGYDINNQTEYNLRFERDKLLKDKSKNEESINKLSDEIQQKEKANKTINYLKFGLYAWTIDLFNRNIFTFEDYSNYTKEIEFNSDSFDNSIEDLLFYYKNDFDTDILGWQRWTFPPEDMLPLKSYWIPSTSDWLVFAFVIKLLNDNVIGNNIQNQLSSIKDSVQFNYLVDTIKNALDGISKDFNDKFSQILVLEKEEFDKRSQNISTFFQALKQRHLDIKAKEIAESPLSEDKINEFKNQIVKQWNDSKTIEDLFHHFDAIKVVEENDDSFNLKKAGLFFRLISSKMMFIDSIHYQSIYGINFGHEIAKTVNNSFFTTIYENISSVKKASNTKVGIDESIERIKNKNFTPDIILIGSMLLYRDNLHAEIKYSEGSRQKNGNLPETFYNDILILPLHNPLIGNRIIIADLKSSIEMLQKRSDQWEESILHIEITEITRDKAEEYANEIENYATFTQEEKDAKLLELMNGIIIKVEETLDFNIVNTESIEIINIEQ